MAFIQTLPQKIATEKHELKQKEKALLVFPACPLTFTTPSSPSTIFSITSSLQVELENLEERYENALHTKLDQVRFTGERTAIALSSLRGDSREQMSTTHKRKIYPIKNKKTDV